MLRRGCGCLNSLYDRLNIRDEKRAPVQSFLACFGGHLDAFSLCVHFWTERKRCKLPRSLGTITAAQNFPEWRFRGSVSGIQKDGRRRSPRSAGVACVSCSRRPKYRTSFKWGGLLPYRRLSHAPCAILLTCASSFQDTRRSCVAFRTLRLRAGPSRSQLSPPS